MQAILDYFLQHLFQLWLGCSVVAGILEVSVPSFTFIFVSLASLVAALVSLRWGPFIQLGAFTGALILSVVTVRPRLMSHKKMKPEVHSRVEVLIGKSGQVTEVIDMVKGSGRVLVEGQDWAARTASKSREVIAAGKQIIVESADGIVLIVRKN